MSTTPAPARQEVGQGSDAGSGGGIFARDGKAIGSAGVTFGIDLALSLVEGESAEASGDPQWSVAVAASAYS